MAYNIAYFYTSNTGKCRKMNQDNFFCDGHFLHYENDGTDGICTGEIPVEKNPVFCVFDGMGGEECGEIAAYLATEQVKQHSFDGDMETDFRDFCADANRSICERIQQEGITSMGTTAAMLRFAKTGYGLCNIGDSKIFLLSDGLLTQLSYDHVGLAPFGRKPPLLQNLGIPEDELQIDTYVALGDYREADIYLICSDGLTDMVSEDRIQQILTENPGEQAAQLLLDEALDNGGRDNVTFILLYITKKERKRFWKEVRLWRKRK
jgi:protein phosphatase